MEAQLPSGTMVFETPPVRFPEGGPANELQEYEPLRPFLNTSTLRFSFGSNQGRPREEWQQQLGRGGNLINVISDLERYGFGGLLVFRNGYPDHGQALLDSLARLGRTNVVEDTAHEQACVRLEPSAHPDLPHSDDAALIDFKRGFVTQLTGNTTNGVVRWTSGDATIRFYNEARFSTAFRLVCRLASLSTRQVTLKQGGKTLWSNQVIAGQSPMVDVMVNARPGGNTIYFETDQPPEIPDNNSYPRIAIGVFNLQIFKATPTGG
jgi:hypothetical protein